MSEKMVANLIPTAAKLLDLGVFNKVAVRDVDIKEEFGDTHSGDAVEVLTFYRTVRRTSKKKRRSITYALHIFLKGNTNKVEASAFVRTYRSKGNVTMGHRWSAVFQGYRDIDVSTNDLFRLVSQESISFDGLSVFISEAIKKSQEIFKITPKKDINKQFYETIHYLTDLYNHENAIVDLMSVHLSSTTLSFSIICETGWGSDYHFNVTKDGKYAVMTMEVDPREVGDEVSPTFQAKEEIKSSDSGSTYEAFNKLFKAYGILNL
ncbi:hypothetical protein [Bacillus sp. AFS040349]|uniref:hypothetical protein n=1 Tax=Bacillus sp. AFS040349 TaxID=2033502 RepID=UPI000BFBD502|nr:hypothetical protein [Bacillus sp. AFS040349]PGT80890.1 hypothetical protein COD11_19395 [Bacillus sp. AFS040349]